MIEDIPSITIPPRSRLYSLPMQGSCGATQESLFDYAQRLSAEHVVSPRRMFFAVYLPAAKRSHLSTTPGNLHPKTVNGVNGTSDLAQEFVAAMERLTGRSELGGGTLLPWRGLLGSNVSFAPSRRWCPHCLAAQSNQEHYAFSLLWSLDAVTACPIHKVQLSTRCGGCGKAQLRLNRSGPLGRCAYCPMKFADSAQVVRANPSDRCLHIAAAAAGMIAIGDAATAFATADNYRARLHQLVATQFAGSPCRFARELNVGRGLLRHDGAVPLKNLLELTCRLGTTPVDFLTGQASFQVPAEATSRPHRGRKHLARQHVTELKDKLDELIADLGQRCEWSTLTSVARRLGVTVASLQNNFPDAMDALRRHNVKVRPLENARRSAANVVAIKEAMRALVDRKEPTSKKYILGSLRQVGIRWQTREDLAAARAELAKLGATISPLAGRSTR